LDLLYVAPGHKWRITAIAGGGQSTTSKHRVVSTPAHPVESEKFNDAEINHKKELVRLNVKKFSCSISTTAHPL